jgi:hypothetical protein
MTRSKVKYDSFQSSQPPPWGRAIFWDSYTVKFDYHNSRNLIRVGVFDFAQV